MKKLSLLFVSILLLTGLAACGKKDKATGKGDPETKAVPSTTATADTKVAPPSTTAVDETKVAPPSTTAVDENKVAATSTTAAAEKELGTRPGLTLALNLKSLKSSPIYAMFKGKIDEELGKTECAKKILDTVESMVLMGDPESFAGQGVKGEDEAKKKDESVYMVMLGADAKAVIACMKESKPELKDGKLNGVDALTFDKDGQAGYVWAGSEKAVVMVSGKYAEKITPGKDSLGKGEVKPFAGDKSIAFTVGELDTVKEASGFLDLAKGLKADVTVTFQDEKSAKMAETQFEAGKKQAGQLPIPGIPEMVKSVKFVRNGAHVAVQMSLSANQVKQLMDLAKGFGGMM